MSTLEFQICSQIPKKTLHRAPLCSSDITTISAKVSGSNDKVGCDPMVNVSGSIIAPTSSVEGGSIQIDNSRGVTQGIIGHSGFGCVSGGP